MCIAPTRLSESKSLLIILLPSHLIFFPPFDEEKRRKHSRPSKKEAAMKSGFLMNFEKKLREVEDDLISPRSPPFYRWMNEFIAIHVSLENTRAWFERNKFHLCMHTIHGIHMLLTVTPITCMLMCTLVHIVDVKGHLVKFCYDRINDSNLANKFVWVRKGTNPHGPKRVWVPKTTPIVFDVGVGSRMT